MKTTRTLRRSIALSALIATPLLLIGCSASPSSPSHAGDINSIRMNPSPGMHTLDQRQSDRINMHARMKDNNLRAISTDLDKMWFVDRPSRLHMGIKP